MDSKAVGQALLPSVKRSAEMIRVYDPWDKYLVEHDAGELEGRIKGGEAPNDGGSAASQSPAIQHQQHGRRQKLGHLRRAPRIRFAVSPVEQAHHALHDGHVRVRGTRTETRQVRFPAPVQPKNPIHKGSCFIHKP